jgi:ABC-type phosphate transport system substrate-binding protein
VRRRTFVGLTGASLLGAILADTAFHDAADAIESFAAVLADYAPSASTGSSGHRVTLTGFGSTFDAPFFNLAFTRYGQHSTITSSPPESWRQSAATPPTCSP